MERDFIPIKLERNRYRKIYLNDIIYCKAERAYSKVKTVYSEFVYSKPLKELSKLINSDTFVRVNRSFIVNMDKCLEIKIGLHPEIILENDIIIKPNISSLNELIKLFNIVSSEIEIEVSEIKTVDSEKEN